jgi:hypothetical protein
MSGMFPANVTACLSPSAAKNLSGDEVLACRADLLGSWVTHGRSFAASQRQS